MDLSFEEKNIVVCLGTMFAAAVSGAAGLVALYNSCDSHDALSRGGENNASVSVPVEQLDTPKASL